MKTPNLIYIMADQMRRDSLGFEGRLPVKTPHFDALADESLVLSEAISTCPLCTPYRALLFTGRYPLSTGMVTNCQAGLDLSMKASENCISQVLGESGYQTAYIGKWHLDLPSRNREADPADGARHWDARTPEELRRGFDYWYAYNAWDGHFSPHYWTGGEIRPREIDQWAVDHETDRALEWLDDLDEDRPYALFLSWNPPHPPYVAPDEYLDLYPEAEPDDEKGQRRRAYFAAVSSLDANLKRLLDRLEERGETENTLFVFTADHGDMLGDHERYGKTIWYKEALEVPFIIRGAGVAPGRSDVLLGSADIMPTLLSLMDLPVPTSVEGRDLSSFLTGKAGNGDLSPREVFFGCYANPGRLLAKGQEPTPYTRAGAELRERGIDWRQVGFRGIRTSTHTLVVDRGNHTEEVHWTEEELKAKKPIDGSCANYLLYDRLNDPDEMTPRVSATCDTPLLKDLASRLRRMLEEQNDPFVVEEVL